MNRLLAFVLSLTILIFGCSSQNNKSEEKHDEKGPKTKIEQLIAKSGIVVIKSYKEVGKITHTRKTTYKGYQFSDKSEILTRAIELIDPSKNNEKTLGLVLQINDKLVNRYYIDYDEIDSLIAGVEYISKFQKSSVSFPMYEAAYSTKGGFRIVVFNTDKDEVHVGIGGLSSIYVDLEALSTFKELVLKSKQVLSEVKK